MIWELATTKGVKHIQQRSVRRGGKGSLEMKIGSVNELSIVKKFVKRLNKK